MPRSFHLPFLSSLLPLHIYKYCKGKRLIITEDAYKDAYKYMHPDPCIGSSFWWCLLHCSLEVRTSLSLSYQSSSCYISVNHNILPPARQTLSINSIANINIWDIIWYLMVHRLVALLSYHQIHSNKDAHLTRALLGEGCWREDM